MKPKECILIINTSYGYCFRPLRCISISSAIRCAKESEMFAYRILDVNGKLIKRGFCK